MKYRTLVARVTMLTLTVACGLLAMSSIADAARDRDHDGLPNRFERQIGTNPRSSDTDADGLSDGIEVWLGCDPLRRDTDDDGLLDVEEVFIGTDPRDADSDDDGAMDGDEVANGSDPNDGDSDVVPLVSELHGELEALTCPTGEMEGSVTVSGVTVAVLEETRFDDETTCEELAQLLADDGPLTVEVKIKRSSTGLLWAKRIRTSDDDEDEVEAELEGVVEDVLCPAEGEAGMLTVGGVVLVLNDETSFEDGSSCAELAELIQSGGAVEVEVRLGTTPGGDPLALAVEIEDDGDDDGHQGDEGNVNDDDQGDDGDGDDGIVDDGGDGDVGDDDHQGNNDDGDVRGGDDGDEHNGDGDEGGDGDHNHDGHGNDGGDHGHDGGDDGDR
jgi:hypothetical protein